MKAKYILLGSAVLFVTVSSGAWAKSANDLSSKQFPAKEGTLKIASSNNDIWSSYREEISRKLPQDLKMRLPSRLVVTSNSNQGNNGFTARIISVDSPVGLKIDLFSCENATKNCWFSNISLNKKTELAARQDLDKHRAAGYPITLGKDVKGYLLQQPNSFNSVATLMWEQEEGIYKISALATERQSLLYMAHSMAQTQNLLASTKIQKEVAVQDKGEQQSISTSTQQNNNSEKLASVSAPLITAVAENTSPRSAPNISEAPSSMLTPLDITASAENDNSAPISGLDQVTNVSQLRDVQPSDWAYEALRSLVERYGCIAGYPDSTFRGNRALTRYEFAAGLNACLQQVEKLIASGTSNLVTKEDLTSLQRLTDEFSSELTALRGKVDNLEARTTFLENHQFSTTALFGGEVIFGLSTGAGGDPPGTGEANTVLTHLTRVGIVSSFTGKDRLRVLLGTGNFNNLGFAGSPSLNTYMAFQSFQSGLANQIQLDSLEYRIAGLGDRVVFTFKPVGFSLSDVLTANSAYYDAGRGAISRFAEASPLFKIGALDSGVGIDWLAASKLRIQFAYGVRNSNAPSQGISGSDHSALGLQFLIKPSANFVTGLAYVNAYAKDGRLDTFTGSFNADTSGIVFAPAQIHGLSGTLQWRLANNITFGTWGGIVYSDYLTSNAFAVSTTYLFSLGLSDPFRRQGDLAAVLIGQPPKLLAGGSIVSGDAGNSIHIEAFYRYLVNDRISITPGFFVVTDPGHKPENNTIFIGTIRTTFRF